MSARAAKGAGAPARTRTKVTADAESEAPAADAVEDPEERSVQAMPDRIVVFSIEAQRYGLPIDVVQEIQQIVALSEIPDDSGAVVGVINLRGAVVPVMDMRRMLGMPDRAYGLQTPMIFARSPRGTVALIADAVEDVVEVPPDCMQAPSEVFALADRLLGVCRLESGPVFVFDIGRLVPRNGRAHG